MKKIHRLWSTAALLAPFSIALAQDDDSNVWVSDDGEVRVETVVERNAEVERQLVDAERRMAEAARQIAELTAERLPTREVLRQRVELFGGDRPRLGVTIGNDAKGAVKGVAVIGVTPGGAADEAGLRSGDLITSINDTDLGAPTAAAATDRLLDFMQGVEVGDTLELGYLRDGKSGELAVEPKPIDTHVFALSDNGRGFRLPSMPEVEVIPGVPSTLGAPRSLAFFWNTDGWGDMELVELNEGLGRYFGTDQGLLVVEAPSTDALQLQDGDVIQKIDGREPSSVRHALRILGSYQAGESLQLEIMRDKKRRTLEVEIPDDLSSSLLPGFPVERNSPAALAAPRLSVQGR